MRNKPKQRHTPIRSCVVCRQTSDKRALLRVARLPEKDGGLIVADPTGKRSGRGAYVCPEQDCIEKAQKQRRFERALSTNGPVANEVFEELKTLSNARQETAVAHSENGAKSL
jgi:predicted RNA-binding protein YlxR (DUF448 family)